MGLHNKTRHTRQRPLPSMPCHQRFYSGGHCGLWGNFHTCCTTWLTATALIISSSLWLGNTSDRYQIGIPQWHPQWRDLHGSTQRFWSAWKWGRKAIYRLKQARFQWHKHLQGTLSDLGYKKLILSDVSIFVKHHEKEDHISMILVYIDDRALLAHQKQLRKLKLSSVHGANTLTWARLSFF